MQDTSAETEILDVKPLKTVRVYADITVDAETKLRMRALIHQRETGMRVTRKEYLEKLINDDVSKVRGASLNEVRRRK